MKRFAVIATVLLACLFASESRAQAPKPGERPVNATAVCKDGKFATETNRDEACKAHRGVQEWWGSGGPPVTANVAGKPAAPAAAMHKQVWADAKSKMYHLCTAGDEHAAPGSEEAPTAREQLPQGELMSEEQAKSRGFRPGAHRLNCR